MYNQTPRARSALSLRQRRWLTRQVPVWIDQRIIQPDQGVAILGQYEDEATLLGRRATRAFIALCALAVLMFAVGVILLSGHNWDLMTRPMKVALIFSMVALTFIASATAYGRGRETIGEVLALLGTLLFGAAIWLLAQVYHLDAHYPAAMLWWGLGTLVTAWLVGSRLCAMSAVVLLTVWTGMEMFDFDRANYLFLPLMGAGGLLAYRLRSALVLLLVAFALLFYLVSVGACAWKLDGYVLHMLALAGGAYFGAGLLTGEHTRMGRAWQIGGVLALLIALIPPSFEEFRHAFDAWRRHGPAMTPTLIAAGVLLAVMLAGFARQGRATWRADWPVVAAALLSFAGLLAAVFSLHGPDYAGRWMDVLVYRQSWAMAFNLAMLLTALWLIVRGVRMDRSLSFFAGVIYLMVLVLLRWIDLIGDMISSAILFFLAGAVLLGTAYFWRKRQRQQLAATGGRVADTEVDHA